MNPVSMLVRPGNFFRRRMPKHIGYALAYPFYKSVELIGWEQQWAIQYDGGGLFTFITIEQDCPERAYGELQALVSMIPVIILLISLVFIETYTTGIVNTITGLLAATYLLFLLPTIGEVEVREAGPSEMES